MSTMRTLHFGLRASDLERSLAFYTAVGYTVIGTVEGTAYGSLTMLQLPGDDFVTIELVYDPAKGEAGPGVGINHLVIQVESLDATRADLAAKGIEPEPIEYPGGPAGRGPSGSPTRTATGSRCSSGQTAMPTASPGPTSPEPADPTLHIGAFPKDRVWG